MKRKYLIAFMHCLQLDSHQIEEQFGLQHLGLQQSLEYRTGLLKKTEKSGYDWLNSLMQRNPVLSLIQSVVLSAARDHGLNRHDVDNFFSLQEKVLRENADETGLQANISLITRKGSKTVHVVTSVEKEENVTFIGCCNAGGQFLPPVLIFKGVNVSQGRIKSRFATRIKGLHKPKITLHIK